MHVKWKGETFELKLNLFLVEYNYKHTLTTCV